eukprot:Colp12_sorted_trinity150504_noHs@14364
MDYTVIEPHQWPQLPPTFRGLGGLVENFVKLHEAPIRENCLRREMRLCQNGCLQVLTYRSDKFGVTNFASCNFHPNGQYELFNRAFPGWEFRVYDELKFIQKNDDLREVLGVLFDIGPKKLCRGCWLTDEEAALLSGESDETLITKYGPHINIRNISCEKVFFDKQATAPRGRRRKHLACDKCTNRSLDSLRHKQYRRRKIQSRAEKEREKRTDPSSHIPDRYLSASELAEKRARRALRKKKKALQSNSEPGSPPPPLLPPFNPGTEINIPTVMGTGSVNVAPAVPAVLANTLPNSIPNAMTNPLTAGSMSSSHMGGNHLGGSHHLSGNPLGGNPLGTSHMSASAMAASHALAASAMAASALGANPMTSTMAGQMGVQMSVLPLTVTLSDQLVDGSSS